MLEKIDNVEQLQRRLEEEGKGGEFSVNGLSLIFDWAYDIIDDVYLDLDEIYYNFTEYDLRDDKIFEDYNYLINYAIAEGKKFNSRKEKMDYLLDELTKRAFYMCDEFYTLVIDTSEEIKVVMTNWKIKKAEQALIDNGIEEDEAQTVLQALGYILLDKELYPENSKLWK